MDIRYPSHWIDNLYKKGTPREGQLIPVIFDQPLQKACQNCNSTKLDGGTLFAWEINHKEGIEKYFPTTGGDDFKSKARLISAPCPVCNADALSNWLRYNCGLDTLTLDGQPALTVALGSPKKGQEQAWLFANKLIQNVPVATALFVGDNGTGKTHLLFALVNGYRVRGIHALYTTSAKMLADIRESYDTDDQHKIQKKYEGVKVLAIDELDRVKFTSWVDEKFFDIINTRFQKGLTTFAVSNRTPDELVEIAEPMKGIVSRFSAGKIIPILGEDLRLKLPYKDD